MDGRECNGTPPAQEEPRFSSAASCVCLHHLGHEFSVDYMHQCFEGEWIRGYQPFPDHHQTADHSSHANHKLATHELKIDVYLSPSCESCRVNVQIRPKTESTHSISSPATKRQRLADGGESVNCDDSQDKMEPTCRNGRMSRDELHERLKRSLPPVVVDNDEGSLYLKEPVGKALKTYSREKAGQELEFVMTIAEAHEAACYHDKIQNLALFFIETADGVELTQTDGGYWKVLYLFQKHRDGNYSLAGYMTLFHFLSPFKKPKPGIVLRICQALLLPPHQRNGHGKMMFKMIHELARTCNGGDEEIVEINVEDPAPAFSALRNRVDYELLEESLASSDTEPWIPEKYWKQPVGDHVKDKPEDTQSLPFIPLSDADAVQAGVRGRITPSQVNIAYELYKLKHLPEGDSFSKSYRLMVKKRLVRVHREELGACHSKEKKQRRLDELFTKVHKSYKALVGKS